MSNIVTRFAPSPTGFLHIGGGRTALFNWLYAKRFGGKMMLRIEDTDRERSTDAAIAAIIDGLTWLGLEWDGEIVYQFSRAARHREVAEKLLAEGKAYYCYASPQELDEMREKARAEGRPMRYDGRWRPENAAGRMPPAGVAPVIRFRNPDAGEVTWNDLVKGPISIANSELDDLVIARGDGVPTYNFAVVVDDIDMKITHVLRGDDHVNNTPRQINLYHAILGPDGLLPQFGHLPMILGPDGQKLSKRHGAVSVMQYDEDGFLPEAVFNYLARLGWSHGDDEKFSRAQLVKWFDLAHVNRAPAQYNLDKLLWLNGEYMKEADDARLAALVTPRIEQLGGHIAGPPLAAVCALLKDRARTLNELAEHAMLFYGPHGVDEALRAQHLTGAGLEAVRVFAQRAELLPSWDRAALNGLIKALVAELGLKMPQVAIPLRVALTGRTQTPSIDAVLELFGQAEVSARLRATLARCA